MNLHVIELINNSFIIADVEDLDEEPSCYLKNCREILENGDDIELKKWPRYTDEVDTLIHSNRIVTISKPSEEVDKGVENKTLSAFPSLPRGQKAENVLVGKEAGPHGNFGRPKESLRNAVMQVKTAA